MLIESLPIHMLAEVHESKVDASCSFAGTCRERGRGRHYERILFDVVKPQFVECLIVVKR